MLKKTSCDKIPELAKDLMEKGTLVAPVRGEAGFNFQEISSAGQVDLSFYNTLMSPKAAFFPYTEDFVTYKITESVTEARSVSLHLKPVFLFGVRPCDVKSFEIMDIHFSGAGVVDPYWQQRREATTVFGYAFDLSVQPDAADFYQTLGIGSADPEGSDVFMIKKETELLFQGITPKGKELLLALTMLDECEEADKKYFEEYVKKGRDFKTRFTCVEDKVIARKLESIFDNTDFWIKVSNACLSCGVCTFVCPTCYCFDICDETMFSKGTRRRVWDSCMFTDFTLEASGHNPRTKVYQRLRQKISHKYSFHIRKYGPVSCVGCGRCTRQCPVNIDIFSIVDEARKV